MSRPKIWRIVFLSLVVLLLYIGFYELSRTPADHVQYAYSVSLAPGANIKPLFPDRDQTQLNDLLHWIQQAEPVDDPDLRPSTAMKSGGEKLFLKLKNGQEYGVDFAWRCEPGHCQTVNGLVTIEDTSKDPVSYSAKSPKLYEFLMQSARIHPETRPMQYPEKVKVGSAFHVEGTDWLTPKVTISIKDQKALQDGKRTYPALWSTVAVPNHGHFSMQIKCPDLPPGEYTLEMEGTDWKTQRGALTIEQ